MKPRTTEEKKEKKRKRERNRGKKRGLSDKYSKVPKNKRERGSWLAIGNEGVTRSTNRKGFNRFLKARVSNAHGDSLASRFFLRARSGSIPR